MGIKEAYNAIKKQQKTMNEVRTSGKDILPPIDLNEANYIYNKCLFEIELECTEVLEEEHAKE